MPLMSTVKQLLVFHFQISQTAARTCLTLELMIMMTGVSEHSLVATEPKGSDLSHFLSKG